MHYSFIYQIITDVECKAVYQSLLHLSWIDKLLDNIKTIFVRLYGDQVKKPNTSRVNCPFDEYFDQQVRELEGSDHAPRVTVTESPLPGRSDTSTEDVVEDCKYSRELLAFSSNI